MIQLSEINIITLSETQIKLFTEQQVDDIIKLKFGALVTGADRPSYVSNRVLGQVFGVSGNKIRRLYMERFESIRRETLPLLLRMKLLRDQPRRTNFGMRFLRKDHIDWITSEETMWH